MNTLKKIFALAGCLMLLGLGTHNAAAQGGRGNFAQMRQDRLDQLRDTMEVKDEGEWKVLSDAIGKVMDAQRDLFSSQMRGMMGRGRQRPPGGDNANADQPPRRPQGFGQPDPDSEALQAAVDAKAPADELKAKLAKVRASVKAKEEKLAAAQESLKTLLSARQEAVAVLNGLVK